MPNVADFSDQEKWMSACVPERTGEGDEHDQAVATCLSMWRERNKAMDYNEEISAIRTEWNRQNPDGAMPVMEVGSWIVTVRSDAVIVEVGTKYYEVAYSKDDDDAVTFAPRADWIEVEHAYVPAKNNALKALSKNDAELRVANYIVLFGGRDLEGLASDAKNADGSIGEYFTAETKLESGYTKAGRPIVDWEHGMDESPDAPGIEDDGVIGFVDWSTAKADARGVWVERGLFRHRKYMKFLEELIDAGYIGTSSQAIPRAIKKADDGEIQVWPIERDALTFTPMDWRNKSENIITAVKGLAEYFPAIKAAIGVDAESHEAEPEAVATAVSVVKTKVDIELFTIETLQEQYQ